MPFHARPRLTAPPGFPLPAGQLPLRKVAWFHPVELLRTGYHAWLSTIAKEYLDRREMLAALDGRTVPEATPGESVLTPGPGGAGGRADVFQLAPEIEARGEVWIDFVADLGDSWEATHAVATLLATPELTLHGSGERTRAAAVVVLGGDLVYPTPTRDGYRYRLRWPLAGAFPRWTESRLAPCLLAIPGNHDWYDGLTNFVREFCQGGYLGGWRLVQHRSYFAVRLMNGWWLWGIDIALDTRVDPAQQAYFRDVLRGQSGPVDGPDGFRSGDRIILCTAKPCWVDDPRHSDEAHRNLTYFVTEVIEKHGGSTPIVLAGDLHHYSRFASRRGRQLIVSGGGGAYVMGTHHLPQRVGGLQSVAAGRDGRPVADEPFLSSGFPYPSRTESRRLALGALLLSLRPANWSLCATAGALYWLFARPVATSIDAAGEGRLAQASSLLGTLLESRVTTAAMIVVLVCCTGFALGANRGSRALRAAWGLVHGLAHLALAVVTAWFLREGGWAAGHLDTVLPQQLVPFALGALMVGAGGLLAGTLLGAYLVLSDRAWGWHRNEVFAVQSIVDFRNFVRMKIDREGSLTIYPIGLRRVPRNWRARATASSQDACYEAADAVLEPHLIEGPVRVRLS
jgi:hypothetical protein